VATYRPVATLANRLLVRYAALIEGGHDVVKRKGRETDESATWCEQLEAGKSISFIFPSNGPRAV
jgi:hypothetical protein